MRETEVRQSDAVRLDALVKESNALRSRLVSEIQEVEKTILTADHRVRTLTADYAHVEQRIQVARGENARFTEECRQLELSVQEAEAQLAGIAASKEAILQDIGQHSIRSESLAMDIDNSRRELGEIQARLA